MDQITAFFEGINWDNVMTVVANYVTKIEIKTMADKLWDLFLQVINIVAGGIISGI